MFDPDGFPPSPCPAIDNGRVMPAPAVLARPVPVRRTLQPLRNALMTLSRLVRLSATPPWATFSVAAAVAVVSRL